MYRIEKKKYWKSSLNELDGEKRVYGKKINLRRERKKKGRLKSLEIE